MLRSALRWPAHVVNGISVALGIALVQLAVSSLASAHFAQAASIGAVLASLPHLSGRAGPIVRRVLVGGLLASLATFLVLAAEPYPALRGLLVAQIAFLALLGMAYGPRAGSTVFSIVIGLVFSLAHPSGGESLFVAGACASGVGLYAVWAFWSTKWLEARYRVLAVAAALDAAGALLRVRARVLLATHVEEKDDQDRARFDQLNDEVQLAQALQSARDLVHPAVHAPRAAMQAAVLVRLGELREIVLTSRLDLELLGHDAAARYTRARLAVGLRHLGQGLAELGAAHREGREAALPTHEWAKELPDFREAAQLLEDERARLLPVVVARLRYLTEEVDALGSLLRGTSDRLSSSPEELRRTVADDETWPLSTLLEHLTVRSPVLRHAVRSALALTTAYFVAYALPWSTKPYWLLLSVAVVLRGTLDDTLSRRNARVLGTAIGCVLVAVTVPIVAEPVLKAGFVIAVGVAHAFVNVRYLLTAIAATVMALLQAHFASPELGFLVAERLLDTVIGALFAWAFSYVLPSWERRTLPIALERVLESLRHYGECALSLEGARDEQRLARQRAYDAIAVVAAALRRSVAEPKRVRPPESELVSALDHAQRLMAHLSSVRSLLTRRTASLPTDEAKPLLERARRQLVEQLQREAPRDSSLRARSIPELPLAPAERDALPWLERRLEASLHDACLAGAAAREALGALDRTRTAESP